MVKKRYILRVISFNLIEDITDTIVILYTYPKKT